VDVDRPAGAVVTGVGRVVARLTASSQVNQGRDGARGRCEHRPFSENFLLFFSKYVLQLLYLSENRNDNLIK
jgi:hypothetical protein